VEKFVVCRGGQGVHQRWFAQAKGADQRWVVDGELERDRGA
jgi:hypothetical protein